MNVLTSLARRALLRRLNRIERGRLTIVDRTNGARTGADASDEHVFGTVDPVDDGGPRARITVHDERFFASVALGGHLGAAESFVAGDWDADDLTVVVRLLLRNRDVLDSLEEGPARLARPLRRALNAMHRNTREGSRRNIAAHYDLGNDLFRNFLDETMTYSCGIFTHPGMSLADASIAKYDRICREIDLSADDRLVEIGSGWGGFAVHAASTYGARVTTATVSREQYEFAIARVRDAGLTDRVEVLLCDYRDIPGRYEKLVSIEMVEAVGHEYLGAYFRRCADLLVPGGRAAIQAITIPDTHYDLARREVDFIKRYIFPGSCIPSQEVLSRAGAAAGLRVDSVHDITEHYGETLRRWRERFDANWPILAGHGYDETFRRLWHFYFAYCEGGFDEAFLGDVQISFTKTAHPRIGGGESRAQTPLLNRAPSRVRYAHAGGTSATGGNAE